MYHTPTMAGDPLRLATALFLWREFHRAGGEGAEPEPDKIALRLAEEQDVLDEYLVLCERLAVKAVVKQRKRV